MLLFLIEIGWVGAGQSATLRLAVIWVVELAVLITAFACLGHSVRDASGVAAGACQS